MQKRELFFFEWVLVDNCNLGCSYCVNKGEYSQKPKNEMTYVPGREVDIARKIVELAGSADRVVVNLTGGDPLISDYFTEVLTVLASVGNISVNLITNLKRIGKYADDILRTYPSMSIGGSLHVHFRSDQEVDSLITFLNGYKDRLDISLSQVDHNLTPEDRKKLARIKQETRMAISFQAFIPPWTEDGKVKKADEIRDASFVTSLGKRCCLGYSHLFLLPDGTIYYDLWCNVKTRKTGDFLGMRLDNFDNFILDDMKICPKSSCGCNYNVFYYADYVAACKRLKHSNVEIFRRTNQRLLPRIKRFITKLVLI